MGNTAILNSCLWKTDLFFISEVGRLSSRNLCRGSFWLSHFQWRFLLEKLPAWTLLNRIELESKLSGQLKQNQLCSKSYCLVNTSAKVLLLNKQRIIIGWQLEWIFLKLQVNLHGEGNIYLLSFSLLHFYQDYFGLWALMVNAFNKNKSSLQIFCIYPLKWEAPSQNCLLVCCLALNQM